MIKQRIILIVVLALAGVCFTGVAVYYGTHRVSAFYSRPLVLIHNPLNQDKIQIGNGHMVHATARADTAIDRMELWADGVFIAEQKSQKDAQAKLIVLSTAWTPSLPGSHTLIVRAFTKDNAQGQATVVVEAVGTSAADETPTQVVQEGDTVESIAEANGLTPEELIDYNPDLQSGDPQPGDSVDVPGDSSGAADSSVPESGPAPDVSEPAPEAEAPESISPSTMFYFLQPLEEPLHLLWQAFPFHAPAAPVMLQVEVLRLETRTSYDSLHCYMSLADESPSWYPDTDNNQATDESFAAQWGGRLWNVQEYMSSDNLPLITWPDDQAIPFDISCVGVVGGGTDAVKLGRINTAAPPETWGIIQQKTSTGGEGLFRVDYKVSLADDGSVREKDLDPNMTSPTNVRVTVSQARLLWDYTPRADEDPINGFAILLNDTLQWTEPASARQSQLPTQWTTPPCGDEYSFTVVAFYGSYPAGTYSNPSTPPAIVSGGETGDRGCEQSVMVTFERLTTGNMGGDGRYDPGDMGPVYGSFFANDAETTFNGIDADYGINNNSAYEVSSITSAVGSGQARILLELPAGDPNINDVALYLGFDIWDHDTGWNHPDHRVCSGETRLDENDLAGTHTGVIETELPVSSLPDRCRVSYTVEPVGDHPVVEPGAPPPLPDLVVTDITIEPASRQLQIHVRNVGTAGWVEKDLEANLRMASGEDLGLSTWPHVTILPGQTRVLVPSDVDPHPALAACVMLDPNNQVEELVDRYTAAGMLSGPARFCHPLPDLTIDDAQYNATSHQLSVTIKNYGQISPVSGHAEGNVAGPVTLWMTLEGRHPISRTWDNVYIGVRGTATLFWPIEDDYREIMSTGYTLTLDPDNDIAETNDENNEYQVPGSTRLRIVWTCGVVDYCASGIMLAGGNNTWDMRLLAAVSGGGGHRTVADWTSPEVETSYSDRTASWCNSGQPFVSDWFEVAGDEVLQVTRYADLAIVGHGVSWYSGGADTLLPQENFGGVTIVSESITESCLASQIQCNYHWGAGGAVSCAPVSCPLLDHNGWHDSGNILVSGEQVNGTCDWATTYGLYKAGE